MKYSSDDEENGMVYIAWRGPLAKVREDIFMYCRKLTRESLKIQKEISQNRLAFLEHLF